ncbi:hypothetical protein [Methylobacterium sp. Leaf111]|uniref:hypothetical protein n=1 Tax=Methylobacterium sp. Leaf111 TaxID=1736257 RepID=UPI001FCDD799|nr:hypothetical protein [Methylobacterium sp. Leaf111]
MDLDDPMILIRGGLDPTEADPRFHQQMVYAVASRTLANFDRALGRRIEMRKGPKRSRLRLFPHGFKGRNAFYDRKLHAVLLGYFDADMEDVGTNIPGQRVFTCLSHDIVAHETTHAIVDQIRPYFLEPSNVDVQAFHEGFSDIVALFQHFSFPNLVSREIQRNCGILSNPGALVQLAEQFGYATGAGKPLRSAIGNDAARLDERLTEPHDRGAILVAAVFDGFFETFRRRIRDLVRIATGGSGELPPGDLQPHLAERIGDEAVRTAQRQLDICIRAFDYLPPVDITFGDYLRAMVTADFELNPDDEWEQRSALIEGFRRRGIYPEGVISLAESSLRWPAARDLPPLADALDALLPQLLKVEAARFSQRSRDADLVGRVGARPSMGGTDDDENNASTLKADLARALCAYAGTNADGLFLRPDLPVSVHGFHAVFRTASNGQLLIELVAQFVQVDADAGADPALGGLPVRGGTTIVVSVDGHVRYAIAKPLPSPSLPGSLARSAERRMVRQAEFVALLDAKDPRFPFMDATRLRGRMKARMSIRSLHRDG